MQTSEVQAPRRPDSDLGKGIWAGSKGLLIAFGVISALLILATVVAVARVRRRARAGEDVMPISSRGGSVRPPPSTRPPRRL